MISNHALTWKQFSYYTLTLGHGLVSTLYWKNKDVITKLRFVNPIGLDTGTAS